MGGADAGGQSHHSLIHSQLIRTGRRPTHACDTATPKAGHAHMRSAAADNQTIDGSSRPAHGGRPDRLTTCGSQQPSHKLAHAWHVTPQTWACDVNESRACPCMHVAKSDASRYGALARSRAHITTIRFMHVHVGMPMHAQPVHAWPCNDYTVLAT